MTRISLLTCTLGIFIVTIALAQDAASPEAMLGAALHQQEVEGDFEGAITAYEKILELPGVPREIAARSLLQIGIASEALGPRRDRGETPDTADCQARNRDRCSHGPYRSGTRAVLPDGRGRRTSQRRSS